MVKINKIKKVILALSLSLRQITFNIGNNVKAVLIENSSTKYCPYRQADHLVDGLLWHYDAKHKKAFFILARVHNGKELKIINDSKCINELKNKHFKEIDIKDLKENYDANVEESFDKYLYDSFIHATYKRGPSPTSQYPNIVIYDFPLYNLAKYYDGDDISFWQRVLQSSNKKIKYKVLTNWGETSTDGHPFLKEFKDLKISNFDSTEQSKHIVLSNASRKSDKSKFTHFSSLDALKLIGQGNNGSTTKDDDRLNNQGFVFTVLCPSEKMKWKIGQYIQAHDRPTKLFFKNVNKLPIVVVSKDQQYACEESADDVYICSGKDLAAVAASKFFSWVYSDTELSKDFDDEKDALEDQKNIIKTKNSYKEKYSKLDLKNLPWSGYMNFIPFECRIPTYLIPTEEDFG